MVERQTRMLQAHVPFGREGSNPFSASWKGGPARYGTGPEIRQVDFLTRVQIPSFPSIQKT